MFNQEGVFFYNRGHSCSRKRIEQLGSRNVQPSGVFLYNRGHSCSRKRTEQLRVKKCSTKRSILVQYNRGHSCSRKRTEQLGSRNNQPRGVFLYNRGHACNRKRTEQLRVKKCSTNREYSCIIEDNQRRSILV